MAEPISASTYAVKGWPPKPVGYLHIADSFTVQTMTRPLWLHRVAMRVLLGWKWEARRG